MGGMGDEVVSPRIRPTVDQNEFDTLTENPDLVLPKKCGLQEAGAGADVVASAPKRIEQAKVVRDKGGFSLAKEEAAIASMRDNCTNGTLWGLMCKGSWVICCQAAWLFLALLIFVIDVLSKQGSIELATPLMQNTSMQILSVFSVVLSWADDKYALGQTDYRCKVLVDPMAGTTPSNLFMVAMTLLASIIIGAFGVAFWVHSRRRNPMDFIDEVLNEVPRMVRNDPDLVPPPAIEPWSGMENPSSFRSVALQRAPF